MVPLKEVLLAHPARIKRLGFQYIAIGVAACLVVAFPAACAFRPNADPQSWRCDPYIDALVENGQWEEALRGHEQLLRETPDNCLARYHIGFIWGHLGERGEEVLAYEQAIACGYGHDDHLYFNLGMAYSELGELQRATEALERAVTLDPRNADNFFGLAIILEAAERAQDAEQALDRALSIDAHHLEARLAIIRLYLDQGRWADARIHLDAAETIDAGNESVEQLREILKSREAAEYKR
jgi:tetratricopeptide (TPR) repeat protein